MRVKRLLAFLLLSFAWGGSLLYWDAQRRPPKPVQITTPEQTSRPLSAPHQVNEKPSLSASLSEARREMEDLRQRISDLDQENEKIKGQLTDLLNWILANVRGRYPVREQDLSHMKLPVVNEDFLLEEALTEFLQLSTDEVFLMEDAFAFTRARLRALQDANLELIQDAPNQIVLSIQSFPEAGAALQAELDLALEASIGPDRLERLKTVSEDTLQEAFDYFGQASRTLIFELQENPATGQPNLIINDGWFNEQNPEQLVYTESEITVQTLPEKYRDFEIYLTEPFPTPP